MLLNQDAVNIVILKLTKFVISLFMLSLTSGLWNLK